MNRLVVIGYGMTAHRLVAEVRARDRGDRWQIVVLGEERHGAYNRIGLTDRLRGVGEADLKLSAQDDPGLQVRTDTRATAIDRQAQEVATAEGECLPYDALVLATGAVPARPPLPGADLRGCYVYRTLDDVNAIRRAAKTAPGKRAVIVGGGLLGLETAEALRRHLGIRPHVVEAARHLMPAQLDLTAAEMLATGLRKRGIHLHAGLALKSIDAGPDGAATGVTLTDETRIRADLVLFTAGTRPRDDLAATADLPRGERGGYLVNDDCRTPDPAIWAIGDCAAIRGRRTGTVAPGYHMAATVAGHLTGNPTPPPPLSPAEPSTVLKLPGVDVASMGNPHPTGNATIELTYTHPAPTPRYAKLILDPEANTLQAAILLGHPTAYPRFHALVGQELPAPAEQLLL
ncbi:NAD(P)/FAD-dependent oxidoreductase [Streptomyces sp. CMB-StM0423]|uniref:NAD(P)/FAD-dependent oxidoreductase n=1 Tax=Streptomyces sp. CMB-StM0423 TaxID=2059884 RepID=UPI000C70AED7|nr:FAD-dependent oxidoreductase [Streptomyces sp. CMB-StM0423]AUH40856.1 FAD-dependent oxidoreductase [Streptomyces sp. CMB-StM0423]